MLTAYHNQYLKKTDKEIDSRLMVKERQLRQTFVITGLPVFVSEKLRVAVLGCGDRRYVTGHRRIFESIFSKPVELTTYDLVTDHLAGEQGVVQTDVTESIPGGPFDIVYADVLLRFIPPFKQFSSIINAYNVLASGGIAIITFDKNDYDPKRDYIPVPGTNPVDLNALQFELSKHGIVFLEVPTTIEEIPPNQEEKMIIQDLVLILRKP